MINGSLIKRPSLIYMVVSRTAAIDLQWMVMSCDPESVERETCDELPVRLDTFFIIHTV